MHNVVIEQILHNVLAAGPDSSLLASTRSSGTGPDVRQFLLEGSRGMPCSASWPCRGLTVG